MEENLEFVDLMEAINDWEEVQHAANISAGDFEAEFDEKFEIVDSKTRPKLDVFERSAYFDQLFPSLKIQKPGYDLYGSTTSFLGVLAIYVFMCYGHMSVDQADYLRGKGMKNNNSIFKGNMVICLLTVILVIVIERYVNRSDTKAVDQKGFENESDKSSFFSQDSLFERTSTARSMTVKLKTMKTADLDMQDNAAQDFLKSMYGADDSGDSQFDDTRTKITTNQKTKYVMHWVLLLGGHIFVFWYIPIAGNQKLYGTSTCTDAEQATYGCKNFHKNGWLQIFYLILCIYFMLSALQIRYGFPIMKKPSSVLQFNDNILALVGANIYGALPFIVEIRCLLDFTFSKTALDIFQFW